LEGDLQMMSLASIIQINCEERNQARLILNHLGKIGTIYFNDGEMIHAETAGISGEEAVFSLLGWENGSFQLKMGAEPHQRTIYRPWSGVLLEGMRRIDESTAGWSPDWEDTVSDYPADEEEDAVQLQARIVKALRNIRDVESAVIFDKDGTILAQESSEDAEDDQMLGQVIFEEAEIIGGFLDGGEFVRGVLSGSENRLFLQMEDHNLILLNLSRKSSAESVYESVKTVHKRYQSS
jgi:predicted regulator of Ras-like GTPase activity (Roadblock/LC7/MglB family)